MKYLMEQIDDLWGRGRLAQLSVHPVHLVEYQDSNICMNRERGKHLYRMRKQNQH